MNSLELKQQLKGPMAFAVTPFERVNGEVVVDRESTRSNAKFLADNHLDIIVPCAGTGEFYSLSAEEWAAVTEETVAGAAGKALVIPAIAPGYQNALEMAKRAEQAGCAGVMVMPPAFPATSDGYYEFYKQIAASVNIGIIPFHAPGKELSIDMLKKLSDIDNVIGFKDEIGKLPWFKEAMDEVGDKLVGICGLSEEMFPYYHLAGAKAFTSGASNVLPQKSAELYQAAEAGDFAKVSEIVNLFQPLAKLRARPGRQAAVVKTALKLLGIIKSDEVRLPYITLGESDADEVKAVLEAYGLNLA